MAKHNLTDTEARTLRMVAQFGNGANFEELKHLGAYRTTLDWLSRHGYLRKVTSSHGATYRMTKAGTDALRESGK